MSGLRLSIEGATREGGRERKWDAGSWWIGEDIIVGVCGCVFVEKYEGGPVEC